MLNEKIEAALNDQVNAEFYSAYLYLAMNAYFESKSLGGFANWMDIQTQEEVVHATKLYRFINERGGRPVLKAIDEPQLEWDSPLAVFEAAYAHEQLITGRINDLVSLAMELKDHATSSFLQWFVDEQVEEEDSANQIVEKIKLMAGAPGTLYLLDQELGQRVFTPPAANGE